MSSGHIVYYNGTVATSRKRGRGVVVSDKSVAPELKLVQTSNQSWSCNHNGQVQLLNGCSQGSDYTDRIGNVIDLVSVYIRGLFQQDGVPGGLGGLARLALVFDREPNNPVAVPAIYEIFEDTGLGTVWPTSMGALKNRDRFDILFDHQVAYQPPGVSPANVAFEEYRLLKGCRTVYSASTGGIAAITSGALYLCSFGSNNVGVGGCSFTGSVRLRFTDK